MERESLRDFFITNIAEETQESVDAQSEVISGTMWQSFSTFFPFLVDCYTTQHVLSCTLANEDEDTPSMQPGTKQFEDKGGKNPGAGGGGERREKESWRGHEE